MERAVLHIASMHGGGVDRHVRDIVRHVDCPQWIWHVAEPAEVLEDPARRSCLVFDREAVDREAGTLGRWLRKQRVGVLHVHSLTRANTHWRTAVACLRPYVCFTV